NPTPNIGDTITFTVTLTNLGPGTATNVVATDVLPAGLTFITATPSQGTYSTGGGTWTVGTVVPGTPQTLTLQALVASSALLTNTAPVAQADQLDPNTANNTASATVAPGGPPPTTATPTPIDARWMLLLTGLLLAAIGMRFARRRG